MRENNNFSIAFWSPLPPAKSGIAHFGQELLIYLSRLVKVDVYTSPEAHLYNYFHNPLENVNYYSYKDWNSNRNDYVNVYQIGNDERHIPVYKQAITNPGVVLLHDLSISSMMYAYFINRIGATDTFYSAFEYSEGADKLNELIEIEGKNDNLSLNDFLSDNYFLRQLLESSQRVVTFLPLAEETIRLKYAKNNVRTVFLGGMELENDNKSLGDDDLLKDLNLPSSSFIIGVFGFVIPSKQIEIVLRTLYRLKRDKFNVHLVIVGEVMSSYGYDLKINSLINELDIGEIVTITGYVDNKKFEKYLVASDCVVILRNPSNFQMSGIVPRALSASKPLILSDIPEWKFLPESCCYFVPAEDFEGIVLEEHLRKLIQDPVLYHDRVNNVEKYFTEKASIEKTAVDIMNIIKNLDESETNAFPELEKTIQLNLKLDAAFKNMDLALQGKRDGKFMFTLKKIPFIGYKLWGIARFISIQLAMPKARKAQYQFNHELVEIVTNLNLQIELLRGIIVEQQKIIDMLLNKGNNKNE